MKTVVARNVDTTNPIRVIEFLNKVGELSSCFNEKGKI